MQAQLTQKLTKISALVAQLTKSAVDLGLSRLLAGPGLGLNAEVFEIVGEVLVSHREVGLGRTVGLENRKTSNK